MSERIDGDAMTHYGFAVSLVDPWTSRFCCVTRAARWCRLASTVLSDDTAYALDWAARWRAAGKKIQRRVTRGRRTRIATYVARSLPRLLRKMAEVTP